MKLRGPGQAGDDALSSAIASGILTLVGGLVAMNFACSQKYWEFLIIPIDELTLIFFRTGWRKTTNQNIIVGAHNFTMVFAEVLRHVVPHSWLSW